MRPGVDQLLGVLPVFNNRSILIETAQDVPDIIREVVAAHSHFSGDYDYIYQFFNFSTVRETCQALFDFCKDNINYQVESEDRQTTKSPSAILSTAEGDCKHYAGFIAGVLSAITRNTGRKIEWRYRFASYDFFESQPGHVFVVVYDRGREFWVDPVLEYFNERIVPAFVIDKKIKTMPLYRISGLDYPGFSDEFTFREQIGFIDPEIAANVIQSGVDIFTKFVNIVKGDKVPNYPVKSQNTLNSLIAAIARILPLPPKDVNDAKRLLDIATKERALSVARGTDRATLTAIQLWDEAIQSLKYYISSKGGNYEPGTELTAGANSEDGKLSPLWLVGGAGLAFYLYSKSKKSRAKVTGIKKQLPILLAVGAAVYFLSKQGDPAPEQVAV